MYREEHAIHKAIGQTLCELVSPYSNLTLLLDPVCGGRERMPLFYSKIKSRAHEFCNVDSMILRNGKIKLIIEIEETNVKASFFIFF